MAVLQIVQPDKAISLSYGDVRAHVLLWQKALLLVPVWAMLIIPFVGFAFHTLGNGWLKAGNGILLSVFAFYFFLDLLKRKIRVDDQYLFFGISSVPIREIKSIDLTYRKGNMLPDALILKRDCGRSLRFKLSCLSDESVEKLLKHLQAHNSRLNTALALPALIRCRSLAHREAASQSEILLTRYHSNQAIAESIDAFKITAGKWMRVGPLIAFAISAPMWLGSTATLFACLHPNFWYSIQGANTHFVISQTLQGFNHLVYCWAGPEASAHTQTFAANPLVIVSTAVFLLSVLAYLRVMFKPNYVLADGNGLKLVWRILGMSIPTRSIRWTDPTDVTLHRIAGRAEANGTKIRFGMRDGKHVDIDLSAIRDSDRAPLLKRIEKSCPNSKIDYELAQSMQPRSERSYTELWLQSLTQAPQRKLLDPLAPGQLVGDNKFEVIRQLGVGGQGSAYLCRSLESELSSSVVLKETVLPVSSERAVREKALARFEHEARMLKSLNSDAIVKLIDYFVEDHRAYLVLEYIEGCTLRELVQKEGPLESAPVAELAIQMCDVLSLLHAHSIVHRDFAPDNLIFKKNGQLKLIDFNVAQQTASGSTGTIVGKHCYLPPEQFRGKPTTQSDLYAMGATLFFLLTGDDPEPISKSSPVAMSPDVNVDLDRIVQHATELSASNRYQSATEIKADLLNMKVQKESVGEVSKAERDACTDLAHISTQEESDAHG